MDRFYDIKYITKSQVYRANWINGCINNWSNYIQNFNRRNQNIFVILKSLNNLTNNISEFMNKVW